MHARIQFQIKSSRLGLPAHGKPHLVMPGDRHRTARSAAILVQEVAWHVPRLFIPQVPHEPVESRFRFQLLFRLLVVRVGRSSRVLYSVLEYLRITLPELSRISSLASVLALGVSFR